MGEAYYSIDVLWDGDDVERRLVECGVLERWKAGEIGSVECVMGGWELSAGKDRESFCCGVYHAPAALQAGAGGGGLVPTSPLSIGPAQTRQASIGTSPCKANIDIRILHPKQDSRSSACALVSLFISLSIGIHQAPHLRSAAMSEVCVFAIVTRRRTLGTLGTLGTLRGLLI